MRDTLRAKFRKFLDRMMQTARVLPIYYNVVPELVSTRIGNFRASGTNFGSFWNLWEWTLR